MDLASLLFKYISCDNSLLSNNLLQQSMIPDGKLDWKQDWKKSEHQLFEKAQNYLFNTLNLPKKRFTGELQMYQEYRCQVNISGDAEWFQPTYALAFGLHYPITQQKLKDHVILYHGVKSNSYIKSILQTELRAGSGQAFSSKPSKNPEKQVPKGIYTSQFMNTTLGYVDNNFPIVFQVAAPSHIVTSRKDYIVVQKALPLKLVCPFVNAPRQDMQ